jgi:crossover junction endodeoxyribonuclease RuvC
MPTLVQTTGRRQIDFTGLAAILREQLPAFVLVERVGSRPGEGAMGAFGFGMSFGGILGILGAMALPHDLAQPASWKRKAGIPPGADKAASIQTCLRLLPTAAPHLTRKKDDGRAEALLLAVQAWQMRTFLTPPPLKNSRS